MFILYADKNRLAVKKLEALASGSVNTCMVKFEFSKDWDGLKKTAVFKSGERLVSVLLDENDQCTVPWEVLQVHGQTLFAGAYGTADGDIVLPTVWASLGTILEGVALGDDAHPPTADLWEQELDQKADTLDYTPQGELGLYAGEKLLSSLRIQGGGGEGGVSDHRLLAGRSAPEQHPITSIDGLADELERIPAPVEPLTNLELEDLLK